MPITVGRVGVRRNDQTPIEGAKHTRIEGEAGANVTNLKYITIVSTNHAVVKVVHQ